MHTINVAKIPIGLDRNINDTIKQVMHDWKETAPGKWCSENNINARFAGVYIVNEELGGTVNIVADVDESTAIAYKLIFGSV